MIDRLINRVTRTLGKGEVTGDVLQLIRTSHIKIEDLTWRNQYVQIELSSGDY